MKQEEKQLLLQDLCTRLPYKIRVKVSEVSYSVEFDVQMLAEIKNNNWYEYPIPYLRPMSSMTEEERKEYKGFIIHREHVNAQGQEWDIDCFSFDSAPRLIDWLNKKMFDYRDLIEKGLALEAPEGMYNITK